jgi:hypothetical protein
MDIKRRGSQPTSVGVSAIRRSGLDKIDRQRITPRKSRSVYGSGGKAWALHCGAFGE